jgi:hypothetical protein
LDDFFFINALLWIVLNSLDKHIYIMPAKEFNTPYPVIDTDPQFFRVIRYMRPTDYAAWGAATIAAPAMLVGMGKER